MKKMRKIIKAIRLLFILILVLLFCLAFCSPRSSFAEDSFVYDAITTYRDFIQGTNNAILSQFYTYGYLGLKVEYESGTIQEYRLNFTVDRIQQLTSGNGYVIYTGSMSYYYWSYDGFLTPNNFGGNTITIRHDEGSINRIYWGDWYYITFPDDIVRYPVRSVTYCDLPDSYYTDHKDGTSLVKHNLYNLPSSFNGVISSPSIDSTLGDNIQSAIDTVAPAPVVTTVPPYQPPVTLPPDIVTMLPPETNEDGTYLIDYSPYIYGEAFEPPVTHYDDNIIYSSAQMINYSFGFFRDSDFFNIAVLACLLAIALHILT